MGLKEEYAAKLAALEADRALMLEAIAIETAENAELEALESDKQRVIGAHEARRAFCRAELLLPLKERSKKDHSDEPRDDDAIHAELAALDVDCARMVAVHDEAIERRKAQLARSRKE